MVDFSGKNILIVDDDEASLFLLKEMLEPNGASLTLVSTFEDFNDCLRAGKFHMVLLDIRLSETSGLELLPKIRKCWPKAFVIAQTAFAMEGDEKFFMASGFDGYISKPISLTELIKLISSFLDTIK